MSKSLKRVILALSDAGITAAPLEMQSETHTAQQAADAAGCHVDQIAKSIIFAGRDSGQAVLFITAGGNQVDIAKASQAAGEALGKADAAFIRAQTGFAIGGVSPIGHRNPIRAFIDPRLDAFGQIWAAAGTPRHIFPISPTDLIALSNAQHFEFTQ
ncbi:YbaK/EbsC family protein [Loktanella sp. D2R18]|uniref:YbaK/EbsC family protein n=1 Tax=Rhodobacterales TaxID=204455 RepID=UPI000DEB08C1|nr:MULTISPECIES: YbaK/EbsC family protein [Rhodobacterales]MDO6589678.1 YbaK/EbsC family protein [Yoonia sp. 1_MG-2023]RBW44303.1 YbaK/EbsC family protein [Loktanella sp. D2R18]